MRRREFVARLGVAATASALWQFGGHAQTIPTIGFLASRPDFGSSYSVAAFLQGLKESGFVKAQNVVIEYRSAQDRPAALPALARELAARTALIATYDTASALAAKAATTTVPIVFAVGADPIKVGLVPSLARPGGNVTGVSFLGNVLGSKRLGLLRELVPNAATFGFLVDPSNPNAEPETADMQAAADVLRHKLVVVSAATPSEIDAAFAKLAASASTRSPSPPMCFSADGASSLLTSPPSPPRPRNLRVSRLRRGWRPHELRRQRHGSVSPARHLCGAHTEGRKARRPASTAGDPVRDVDQSQDCPRTRPSHPGSAAGHRDEVIQ
jgi:hypothetical protein